MGMKNVILTAILMVFITAHVSNAEFLWNFRKLATSSPSDNSNATVSPSPSPIDVNVKSKEVDKQSIPPSITDKKDVKDEQQVANVTVTAPAPVLTPKEYSDSPKGEAKGDKNDTSSEKGKNHDKKPKEEGKEKEKGEEKPFESCDGMERKCQDGKSLVACVKSFDVASKALVLLIQNKRDSSLKVDYTFSAPENKQDLIEISKLQTEQVNISVSNVGVDEIKLNAGNGYCVLPLKIGVPVFQGNYFQWLPSYSKFMTPMYGAYLVLATTLITAGICACFWFRKRRHSDVPYQELEMSVPESAAAAAATETTEGWDVVWDDDWDEEKAVRSPGHAISANGLTSRAPKKDDWEDWDD